MIRMDEAPPQTVDKLIYSCQLRDLRNRNTPYKSNTVDYFYSQFQELSDEEKDSFPKFEAIYRQEKTKGIGF